MTALLRDAFQPNLVQTLEHTPALIHGGPFANIAHGCNSLVATRTALKLADYVVTEAGFGADLGAEKFFDIKCRIGGLKPAAAVIVATVRALKMHGGRAKNELGAEDVALAETVAHLAESGEARFAPLYPDELPLADKIRRIATEIYRARAVEFAPEAAAKLADYEAAGFGAAPVCMAKTQYSFSADPNLLGA